MAEPQDSTEPSPSPSTLVPTPLVRRNFPPTEERPALTPEIEAQFSQLMQAVQALSSHFFGQSAVEPAPEIPREKGPRRIKKFQRASSDDRLPSSGAGEETAAEPAVESAADGLLAENPADETDSLARNKHIAWPRQSPAADVLPADSVFPAWHRLAPETRQWVGAAAGGLLLLLIGLVIGRGLAPHTAAKTGKAARTASNLFGPADQDEQALLTANEALRAEHSGNADAARKLYEAAVNKQEELPEANYRLALLALQRNDRVEAEQRLERSVLAGEEVAPCCYLLARLAADSGDLEEQAGQFEAAMRARPFDGRYFFFYAETLRRQGKPQAAIPFFERALDRPYTALDGDLYLFKERLAKVEFGRDDAFNAELAAHLKQEPVSGDWLLLAAAQNLDRQEFTAAADRLRQAANRLPSGAYADLTHDYFFQTQAKRPEVAAWLNRVASTAVSSAGPTVLDPATWPPQRADPANWPLAGGQSVR